VQSVKGEATSYLWYVRSPACSLSMHDKVPRCNTPSFHCSHYFVIYNASSCNFWESRESELDLVCIQNQISFLFLSNQVYGELLWKLQFLPYNGANLEDQVK
jgi:hypothetical protein